MARITHDRCSFSLDGQRIWLVSGAIHYPRVARGLWRDRIRAARQAGLNCIETYGFWNAHEKTQGAFDFTDNLDVRHFVELVAQEGMFCIVRPGPYVCAEWDNGGLPAWLHRVKPDRRSGAMRLREGSGPFLSAVSSYYTAFMGQLKDLQLTTTPPSSRATKSNGPNPPGAVANGFTGQGNGSILMVQVENEWFSHNDEQDELYHQQLIRFLREAGVTVPLSVCNQLWQEVGGTIHTWNGSGDLPASLRQLHHVQPEAPRLVSEYWPGWFDQWGGKHADSVDAGKHLYRMAGVLATASQYNLYMFHGGTNFGFHGGRTVGSPDTFMTTSYDYDAPLLEAGGRGAKYDVTKRISTFASQFAGVLSQLDPRSQSCAVAPDEKDHPLSVTQLDGTRGSAVFLLRSEKDRSTHARILLPDGQTLPVPLGDQRATWLLLDARIGPNTTLDYSNLSPFAFVEDRLLVVFGPAGGEGVLSINSQHIDVNVPTGKSPRVEHIDGITLVVLSTAMVDASYLVDSGLAVGCAGLDGQGKPLPATGWPTLTLIGTDGRTTTHKSAPMRKPVAPRLRDWSTANADALLDGSAKNYKPIKGPASHDLLGNDLGYGWYHLQLPPTVKAVAAKVLAPGSGDRLHVYRDGKFEALLGLSAGGSRQQPVAMKLAGNVTVLCDNLGRFNYGQRVGEQKGLLSHFYAVKPVKLGKPKRAAQPGADPFELVGYVHHQRRGDSRPAEGLSWSIKPAARSAMILEFHGLPVDAVLKVNGQPVGLWHREASGAFQQWLLDPADDGPFTGGANTLELALFKPLPAGVDVLKHVTLYQTTANLTAHAKWSFAPWHDTPPPPEYCAPLAGKLPPQPTWFRARFSVASTRCPLFLHPRGMSKGQLYLNGHNLGRYFMQTREKKAVPPQSLYYLPEPWLHTDRDNVLCLFDEHGFPPTHCVLSYRERGPYQ